MGGLADLNYDSSLSQLCVGRHTFGFSLHPDCGLMLSFLAGTAQLGRGPFLGSGQKQEWLTSERIFDLGLGKASLARAP